MKKWMFTALCLGVFGQASFAEPLSPFCSHSTLFGPCGVGSAGPGGYYGVTFPPGYWPPYFAYEQRYAAIAYATDGSARYGASWNWLTLEDASAAALDYCGSPHCQIRTWALNGCASIATVVGDPTRGGFAWHNLRGSAKSSAIMNCQRLNHTRCETVVSVCNGW